MGIARLLMVGNVFCLDALFHHLVEGFLCLCGVFDACGIAEESIFLSLLLVAFLLSCFSPLLVFRKL